MTAIILTLFLVALGLAFALGFVLGQRQTASSAIRFEITIPPDTPPGDSLYLTGSFNDWEPADPAFALTRTANLATGTWTFTNGQTLEYKLTRGDWTSVEQASSHRDLPNHQFTVNGNATLKLEVVAWSDQAYATDEVFDERVERIDFQSEILGIERTFYVYIPPEARTENAARVPAIYLFRGHEREWINKREDGSRGGKTNVIDVYEELHASGAVGPMALIFPGLTSANGQVHSLGINMRNPERSRDATIGTGRFEDYLLQELIPYVETHYPVLAGGEHRAIDGFSLGGFVSVNLALRNPGEFQSVGAYDGLYFWDEPTTGTTIASTDTVYLMPLFDSSLGIPRDQAFSVKNNPLSQLRLNGTAADDLQWLIEFGPKHAEPNVNYFRGQRLIELLQQRGITNDLNGALVDGIHNWHSADEHMRRALPLHWERIN